MSILSKFCTDVLGLTVYNANCHEFGHTWNPGCYRAIFETIGQSCFFSFKTYAAVYLLEAFLTRRIYSKKVVISILKDISRSSFFLVFNLAAFLWFMCKIRRLLGFYTLPTMGFVNGILSSFLSILIENPRRRPMLALYLMNLASETGFQQMVNRGYLKCIPKGQILLFSFAIAGFICLYKKKLLPQKLLSMVKFTHYLEDEQDIVCVDGLQGRFSLLFSFVKYLRNRFPKHKFCKHRYSCFSRSSESFAKSFTIGCGLQFIFYTVQNMRKALFKPVAFLKHLFRFKNLKLPLFLGVLPLIYQLSRCILNRVLVCQGTLVRDAFCGALSGLAMFFYPSTSVAMYFFWKCAEAYYFSLAKAGYVPIVPYAAVLMYSFSTGYVLWNVVTEPRNLRRGYWEFLVNLSAHRVKLLNRRIFDNSRFRSSHVFPGLQFSSTSKVQMF